MEVRLDRDDDAAYVRYIQEEVDRTQQIDNSRLVDWSATDAVIGIEFLDVSDGVLTADLPVDVVALQQALVDAGIGVLDRLGVVGEGVHLGMATDGMGAQQPLPHVPHAPYTSTPWKLIEDLVPAIRQQGEPSSIG